MARIADRPRTLAGRSAGELEGLFARGGAPDPPPRGRLRGSLLHLTLGPAGGLLTPAAYQASWPEDSRSYRALAFSTIVGPGALDPGIEVLRIDYDLPGNVPPFRRILDELVEVEPGVYLGQALLRHRGGHRRLAWFTLEA